MGGPSKYGSEDVQNELRTKLESLFTRENLEKDVYFIARMKDSLEIPMQVVYQQRDIYKICPNGRYVLQAILNCKGLTVSSDKLFVVPQILPKKVCVSLKVSDSKSGSIEKLLQHIQQNYKQTLFLLTQASATSAILTVPTEEDAQALHKWIQENVLEGETAQCEIILEDLLATFKENVKEELNKYFEKLNEDKKSTEMFENLEFFSHQSQFPVEDKNKIGDNVFSNPYNYFFYQQPQQEVNQLQPYLAYIMMQRQAMMMGQQGQTNTQDNRHNLRRNKHGDHEQQLDQQHNKRYKSRGRQGEANNSSNKDGKQKYTFVAKNSTSNKKGAKKSKPFQQNEDQFPSLNAQNASTVAQNATPAQEQNKSQDKITTPAAPVNRTSRKENVEKSKVSKEGNAAKEQTSERQVSESRERQISRNHQKSVNHKNEETNPQKKTEEVVFFRKGKDIKIAYEKDALLNIFLGIKARITPPASIVESSKDEFIPVININAAKDIEHTHPTEVELLPLSNPGTPYQQAASVPLRKPSISRSNIGRKESEKILEVDEKKKL